MKQVFFPFRVVFNGLMSNIHTHKFWKGKKGKLQKTIEIFFDFNFFSVFLANWHFLTQIVKAFLVWGSKKLHFAMNLYKKLGLNVFWFLLCKVKNLMISSNLKNLTQTDLPKEVQPQFILDVEKSELHINAGLQDRVIQVIVFAKNT